MDLISWMRLYEVNEKEKDFAGRTHLKNCDLTEKDEIKEDTFISLLITTWKERPLTSCAGGG